MGILTLAQIRTEVDSAMGNRPGVDNARINTWINLAYTDIATGVEFEELYEEFDFPTVVGQYEYPGPVNPTIVQMLRDETNNRLLTWIPKFEYYRLNRTNNDTVRRWTRRGSEILVWPPPSAIVQLKAIHKIAPTALAADGDLTVLPSYVDNAMLFLATSYGLLAVNEDQRAVVWLNRAVSFLQSRLTDQDLSFLLGGLEQTRAIPEVQRGT